MPPDTPLLVEKDGPLLTLTLNHPEAANALSPDLVERMIDAIEDAAGCRLCVILGAGRHFCAGFDLADLAGLSDGDLLWRFLRIEQLLQVIHHAPFVTLALAQGQCIGAGADLFAACTRRVATAGTAVRMPGWNFELALGTRRLARLIGADEARRLLIDTKTISGEEALSLGLATALGDQENWPAIIEAHLAEASALSERALADMLSLTAADSRDQDLAAIVRTAGRPGLKDRIVTYRNHIAAERERRHAG